MHCTVLNNAVSHRAANIASGGMTQEWQLIWQKMIVSRVPHFTCFIGLVSAQATSSKQKWRRVI